MPPASPPRTAAGKGVSGRKAMRSGAQHPCHSEHGGTLPMTGERAKPSQAKEPREARPSSVNARIYTQAIVDSGPF